MSLEQKISKATLGFRDVEISLDGELVVHRELALAAVKEAAKAHTVALVALQHGEEQKHRDDRLGRSVGLPKLKKAVKDTEAGVVAARAKVEEIEAAMAEDLATFRVLALPKDTFNELKLEGAGDASKTYSLIARASVKYVNDAGEVEPIAAELWDQLEPNLTEGQWQLFVNAIDELNIISGRNRQAFLALGSETTPS